MASHHLTPPIRGGERPRLPSSQIGPVTQAIRAMRAAEPIKTANFADFLAPQAIPLPETANFADLPHDPDLDRQRIRDLRRRIAERIEADIALLDALDGDADFEFDDEREQEDEHGGDVQDEPHDPEEDAGADEDHSAAFMCEFNGQHYAPVIGRRRT